VAQADLLRDGGLLVGGEKGQALGDPVEEVDLGWGGERERTM